MALFGANTTPEEGCRRVLEAARRMSIALDELNQALRPISPSRSGSASASISAR